MAKKQIVINRSQLRKLNEVDLSVPAAQNTGAAYGAAVSNSDTRNQLRTLRQNSGEDTSAVVSGPNSNENSGIVNVEVPQGKSASDVITQDPGISKAIEGGARALVTGPGFPMEGKHYTKKELEEARIEQLKECGYHFTKKNLLKEFDEVDYVDRDELIDFCRNNDFYYVIKVFGIQRLSVANSSEIQNEIIDDIQRAGFLKFTHEVDDLVSRKFMEGEEFDVVKVCSLPDEDDYYIVWDRD